MLLLLKNPNERIVGERKSKLLDENSELYKLINRCREWLINKGYQIDCRPPHIELLKDFEKNDVETLIKRSLLINGREIPIQFTNIGKAFVLLTGNVKGYGETHCTIAYFPKGLDEYQNILKEMCLIYK